MTDPRQITRLRVLGGVDLRDGAGREIRAVLAQPKRLALLAYLAVASADRFVRRDTLTSLFWPESDQDAARHSLRTSLHFLRQHLGDQILDNRGQEELQLHHDGLWSDLTTFERELTDGRASEAMNLYRGHFLEGFFVPDASPDLDLWIDQQRTRLRVRATEGAVSLAESAARDGNTSLAWHWTSRGLELEPHDETVARRLMNALARAGDKARAIGVYEELAARLAHDLEVEPSTETKQLADRLRRAAVPTEQPAPAVVSSTEPASPPARPNIARPRPRQFAIGLVVSGALVLMATVARLRDRAAAPMPILAVGSIENRLGQGADSVNPGDALRDLIATDLARVDGVQVVSEARLIELLAQAGVRQETPSARTDAARRAGARELLEGVVYRRSPDRLRLDLRRVNLASGVVRGSLSVEAVDVFGLADSATVTLGRAYGRTPPRAPLGQLVTGSLVARRFYEEGLRAYYNADAALAVPMFQSALAEDSTFAMAAYYAARAVEFTDVGTATNFIAQAKRSSGGLPTRERLLVQSGWAEFANDPSLVALAESLATRFPTEPDGEYAWGKALAWSGDAAGSIAHFQRAAAMDSLSLGGRSPGCRACEALEWIVVTQAALGNWVAAESTARNWVARQPRAAKGWWVLADLMERAGRETDALEATRRFTELVPNSSSTMAWRRARLAIRAGRFLEADQLLNSLATGRDSVDTAVWWWRVISLRNQGRLGEALEVARRISRWDKAAGDISSSAAEAQVTFELGRFREAARLFEEIAQSVSHLTTTTSPITSAPSRARGQSWYLTHAADAVAADGDTSRLVRLADSVERIGAQSAFGRDQRLHLYLRGLLALARRRPDEAETLFRRARVTPIGGFSRINLALGRLLIERGRPRDAVEPLRAGLQFDLEASNYYVTHRELHAELARAFRAAGTIDSAAAHEAWGKAGHL